MKKTILQLESVISIYARQVEELHEEKWTYKPNPDKWSRKEILGHLIDSAQNNIRRFIVAQYEDKPRIVYAQDNWVTAANYQNYTAVDLVALWLLLNRHIAIILKNVSEIAEERLCDTGEMHSIKWLAQDYNKHLLHHLHQLLDLEPIPYP